MGGWTRGPGACPRGGYPLPLNRPYVSGHLTSVKLLALRVNVFHIKNILKQDARHARVTTRAAEGLGARPRLGVHPPPHL